MEAHGAGTAPAALPPQTVMMDAFMERDPDFDGLLFAGVRTTGIFCRPTCPARKPRPENVSFFPSAREALAAGFRPCRRCRPMEAAGAPPRWVRDLLSRVDDDPSRRWTDQDLRALDLAPERVRRWFVRHHGMTFHAYSRARRIGMALASIQDGSGVATAAFDHGYESLSGFNEAFRQLLGRAPTELRGRGVIWVRRVPTELGLMVAGATDEALVLLEFHDRRMLETQLERLRKRTGHVLVPGGNAVLAAAAEQLAGYFAGRRTGFDVPVELPGTDFQREVWEALREIPYGETTSYGALAASLGRPRAVRAVARANGDNRVAIVVPCHRVVGADGSLTGYGGGLWRKERLLEMERAAVAVSPPPGNGPRSSRTASTRT